MKVCIAEKPSVAREIANILGANVKRDGFYEGNGYAVTYTFGHLCTLFEPHDYKAYWKSWDLNNLPMLPDKFQTKVVSNSGIKKQFNIVKNLFAKATLVINCGDAGQEGELIQRWVIHQAGYQGEIKRLWISSLTSEAIIEGFKNLKPSKDYDNLYYAGYSRAIGDWLLGMNATRLFTVKHGGYKQVLSVGRVQTPTLAMVVTRFKEIENFVSQPFWELQTLYRNTLFNYEDGRFLKKSEGEKLADKVKGHDFEIIKVSKKNGKEYAPKLFDLTGLQVYCNNKFGFTAEETLKIVQKLYEQKMVTYPRVDTTFLPTDIYPKVKGILRNLKSYSTLTTSLLTEKIKKSSRVFNNKKVTDHHAIIPTGVQINLPYNQKAVYDIICKRFIAVFYEDCVVSNTMINGKVEDIVFKTTGKEIIKKGWRLVFENTNDQIKIEGTIIPKFVAGESGPHKPSFLEKATSPPKNFSEATLLRAMESAGKQIDDEEMREMMKENGIGRPSTRANIIETLFKRKYILRKKKQVLPTETGIQLIDTIKNELLKSAELTGMWEKQLKEIEKGKFKPAAFINNMKRMVDNLVYEVRTEKVRSKISHSTKTKERKITTSSGMISEGCPKCKKGNIIKGNTAYGCTNYKMGCDFQLPFLFMDKKVSEIQYKRLLLKGSTVNLKGFKTGMGKVEGLIRFNEEYHLVLEERLKKNSSKFNSVKKPKDSDGLEMAKRSNSNQMLCPKCKKGHIIKGNKAYGCSEYKNGCNFIFSFNKIRELAKGIDLTKELVYKILKTSAI